LAKGDLFAAFFSVVFGLLHSKGGFEHEFVGVAEKAGDPVLCKPMVWYVTKEFPEI